MADPWDNDAPVDQPEPTTEEQPDAAPWESDQQVSQQPESSGTGAFVRGAERGTLPLVGAVAAGARGAAAGGAMAGLPGAIVGGLAGAAIGGGLVSTAQDWVAKQLGLDKTVGAFNPEQTRADIEQHPYAEMIGESAALPVGFSTKAATMASRALGAAAMTGFEAFNEYRDGDFDPVKLAIAAGTGAVFSEPRPFMRPVLGESSAARRPPDMDIPDKLQEKQDAQDANQSPNVNSRGVAPEQPPAPEIPNVGFEGRSTAGPEDWSKKTTQEEQNRRNFVGVGDIPTDVMNAMQESVTSNSSVALQRPPAESQVPQREPLSEGIRPAAAPEQQSTPTPPAAPERQTFPEPTNIPQLREPAPPQQSEILRAANEAKPIPQEENPPAWREQSPAAPEEVTIPQAARPTGYEAAPADSPNRYSLGHIDPELAGVTVERSRPIGPDRIVAGTPSGQLVMISPDLPKSMMIGKKPLDPAVPLAIRESVAQITHQNAMEMRQQAGMEVHPEQIAAIAREAGDRAANNWLETNGYKVADYHNALGDWMKSRPLANAPVKLRPGQESARETLAGFQLKEPALPAGNEAPTLREAPAQQPLREAPAASPVEKLKASPKPEHQAAAKAIEAVKQPKLREVLENRAAQLLAKEEKAAKRPIIPGTEMQARTLGEVSKKGKAVEAINQAFNEFRNMSEDKATLKSAATNAFERAKELNGGVDPLRTYAPKTKSREYNWLRQAKKLATGKISADQFLADHKILTSEDKAAHEEFRKGNIAESEAVRKPNRGAEETIAAKPEAGAGSELLRPSRTEFEPYDNTSHFESEKAAAAHDELRKWVNGLDDKDYYKLLDKNEDLDATVRSTSDPEGTLAALKEDLKEKPTTPKPVEGDDLTTTASFKSAAADSDVLQNNLIKSFEGPGGETKPPPAQAEREASAIRTGKVKQAQEAASIASADRVTKKGTPEKVGAAKNKWRKVDITPEENDRLVKQFEEAKKKADLSKGMKDIIDEPPAPAEAGEAKVPDLVDIVKRMGKDVSGKLDDKKVSAALDGAMGQFKAQKNQIYDWLHRYLGMTFTEGQRRSRDILAMGESEKHARMSHMVNLLDARHRWFLRNTTEAEQLLYQKLFEQFRNKLTDAQFAKELENRGIDPARAAKMSDGVQAEANLYDEMFRNEEAYGTNGDYREGYLSHIFDKKDLQAANDYLGQIINAQGPRWFQKERMFDLLEDAMKKFKPKYTNPMDVLYARWSASINATNIVNTLRRLQEHGLAFQQVSAPDWAKKPNSGFAKKVLAPDRTVWMLHDNARYLWENAVEAKGIAERNDVWGSFYRNWMKLKNIWAPVELSLSAFHAVHVLLNIHPAEQITRALQLGYNKGGLTGIFPELAKAGKLTMQDLALAARLDKIPLLKDWVPDGSVALGRDAKQWWNMSDAEMAASNDPMAQVFKQWFKEAGYIPTQTPEERIGAKMDLQRALASGNPMKVVFPAIRRGIEKMQDPLFKHIIPELKNISLMRDMTAAVKMNPELAQNPTLRRAVFGQLARNVDDRYGQMFYKALFWNRYVKDANIAAWLSLSWNLGQFRQFFGALNTGRKLATGAYKPNTLEANMAKMDNKMTFVSSYIALSMASAGALSFALSGQMPSGLDWFFPRNGHPNPDGSPGRLTVPFNTREPFMLSGHVQETNSALGGIGLFLWNKLILSPITEAWNNRDFFGRELYDPDAPFAKRVAQLGDSLLGAHMNPISLSGSQRAKELGGGKLDQALAFLGFSPAPKYISHTGIENRINHLYMTQGRSESTPYEYGAKTGLGSGMIQGTIRALAGDKTQPEMREEGRAKMNQGFAIGRNTPEGEKIWREGANEMRQGGLKAPTIGKLRPEQEFQYKFSKLPPATQKRLYNQMSPQEKDKYVTHNPALKNPQRYLILH